MNSRLLYLLYLVKGQIAQMAARADVPPPHVSDLEIIEVIKKLLAEGKDPTKVLLQRKAKKYGRLDQGRIDDLVPSEYDDTKENTFPDQLQDMMMDHGDPRWMIVQAHNRFLNGREPRPKTNPPSFGYRSSKKTWAAPTPIEDKELPRIMIADYEKQTSATKSPLQDGKKVWMKMSIPRMQLYGNNKKFEQLRPVYGWFEPHEAKEFLYGLQQMHEAFDPSHPFHEYLKKSADLLKEHFPELAEPPSTKPHINPEHQLFQRKAKKYGRLDQRTIDSYFKEHQDQNGTSEYHPILQDLLMNEDDPRHHIVAKHNQDELQDENHIENLWNGNSYLAEHPSWVTPSDRKERYDLPEMNVVHHGATGNKAVRLSIRIPRRKLEISPDEQASPIENTKTNRMFSGDFHDPHEVKQIIRDFQRFHGAHNQSHPYWEYLKKMADVLKYHFPEVAEFVPESDKPEHELFQRNRVAATKKKQRGLAHG